MSLFNMDGLVTTLSMFPGKGQEEGEIITESALRLSNAFKNTMKVMKGTEHMLSLRFHVYVFTDKPFMKKERGEKDRYIHVSLSKNIYNSLESANECILDDMKMRKDKKDVGMYRIVVVDMEDESVIHILRYDEDIFRSCFNVKVGELSQAERLNRLIESVSIVEN